MPPSSVELHEKAGEAWQQSQHAQDLGLTWAGRMSSHEKRELLAAWKQRQARAESGAAWSTEASTWSDGGAISDSVEIWNDESASPPREMPLQPEIPLEQADTTAKSVAPRNDHSSAGDGDNVGASQAAGRRRAMQQRSKLDEPRAIQRRRKVTREGFACEPVLHQQPFVTNFVKREPPGAACVPPWLCTTHNSLCAAAHSLSCLVVLCPRG